MDRKIYLLLVCQFLSAFADNAILFTVIAIVMQTEQLSGWYVPALQSVFLIAFVTLAPWVGSVADRCRHLYLRSGTEHQSGGRNAGFRRLIICYYAYDYVST